MCVRYATPTPAAVSESKSNGPTATPRPFGGGGEGAGGFTADPAADASALAEDTLLPVADENGRTQAALTRAAATRCIANRMVDARVLSLHRCMEMCNY